MRAIIAVLAALTVVACSDPVAPVKCGLPGDVDLDMHRTIRDHDLILDIVVGRITVDSLPQPCAADATGDGFVTACDAAWVLQHLD